MPDERTTILAGTDEGLHVWKDDRAAAVDELAGREISALAADGRHWWAIVDGRELWQSADALHWTLAATVAKGKPRATCLASTVSGLLVGTARAHLARLTHGRLVSVAPFDEAEGRDAWYTPWGAPADVRSISADGDRAVYVNVHVGGVLRSAGGDAGWSPTLDIEHDVHQVLAVPGHAGTVVVAAADGFGITEDAGRTWRWDNAGLHAHYCRAVAVAGDTLLLSAATSYQGRQACVYRRPLSGGAPFERCRAGLPDWFPDNVDTGCLATRERTAVIGTEDGCVYASGDAGESWSTLAKSLSPVRAVALALA
jgi:hypothetical protein